MSHASPLPPIENLRIPIPECGGFLTGAGWRFRHPSTLFRPYRFPAYRPLIMSVICFRELPPSLAVDTHKDGTRTLSENADGITLHNGSGPIDTALETVDALLDPNGSDDEWRKNVFALLGDDGAGESHPVSDAPRWWWTQRRFHAGSVCSGQYDDKYVNYAYTCTSDGKWEGSDTDAIQSQPFWTTKETSFPIPEGGGPSSTTDPQQTVSQAYNTVLLPMDDGNWHVTVYCPAALDASLLDKDANELDPDQVKAGDEAYTVISATGYGTVQHPCRTVEVVVGGQKPFWSLRNTQ